MELTFDLIDIIDAGIAIAGATIVVSFGLFNYEYFKIKYFGPVLRCGYCDRIFSAQSSDFTCNKGPCPFSNPKLYK